MFRRLRYLIITAVAVCHLLSGQAATPPGNQLGTPARQSRALRLPAGLKPGDTLTITADRLQATLTPARKRYVATGAVEIDVPGLRLSADRMSYDSLSGEAIADGHVAFDSADEQTHIEGTHASYNFLNSTGEFDNFQGVSGLRMQGRQATPLSSNPLIFTGKKLLRLGPDHYRLDNGTVTSCTLPHPKWILTASHAEIELGQNARLDDAVFRLFDVPIFYAPFLTHSTTRNGRHSGLLLPVASQSNIKGYILGDSFYWAAARNLNLTAGGEYYSSRGWADHLDIQSLPTRNSALGVQVDGVVDRLHQGGQEVQLNGDYDSGDGFRSVLDVDYLSSYLYRLEFKNTFADAINSEATSTVFTEKQFDGQDISVVAHRYQDFLGSTPSASLTLTSLPALDWNAYAQALTRHLPLYFSWDANAGLLDRSDPGFATGVMERFDLEPQLTMPLATPIGSITGSVSVRTTYYSETQENAAAASATAAPQLAAGDLWRDSGTVDLEWRPPALEKVFTGPTGWFGSRLEHVFEPQVGYHYTGGVDDPNAIIPFDDRDILTDTSEVEYGFTNRVLEAGATPGASREIFSWSLLQKYFFDPTFGGALTPGSSNVLLTTELLSPFDVEALPLRFSPLSSVMRVSPFTRFDGEWRLDYDSHDHQIMASAFSGNFHFGKGFFSGSHYMLHPPAALTLAGAVPRFNQLRLSTGYGNATAPGYSLAGGVAYDARTGQLQYTTLEATHNWDCCGFSLEYRRFALASVRRENQFLISFNLSNVATFGNLKRQDQLF